MSEISDIEGLKAAVQAVGRSADGDEARASVIDAAKRLGHGDLVPDAWSEDGSLRGDAWTSEQRETYNDTFTALNGAVSDAMGADDDDYYCSCWVQDFTDSEVIFYFSGDLWSVGYTLEPGGAVTLDGEAVKVRPVTSYVARGKVTPLLEWRRRKAEQLKGLERREFAVSDLELRDVDDDTWQLTGYASVTETPYEVGFYTETIKRGAFKRTLRENPDVQLLINHEGMPLARTRSGTLRLEERERGLWVDADLDKQDPDAQRLYRKMQRGDIDQMSFAFQATDSDWSEDYTSREIKGLSIHRGDVSVVNQGANQAALASVRSAEALSRIGADVFVASLVEWRNYTLLAVEERAGKSLSGSTMEVLSNVLNLIASADDAVDEAQPMLAELMGVPNPDADETDESEEDAGAERAAESEPEAAVVALPDYTTRARERLATLRRR